jgi:hypothetical protein
MRFVGRLAKQISDPCGAVTGGQQLIAYAVGTGRPRRSAEREQRKDETNTHDFLLVCLSPEILSAKALSRPDTAHCVEGKLAY